MKFTNCDLIQSQPAPCNPKFWLQSVHWKVLMIERKGEEHMSPIDTVHDVICSLKYSTAWHTLFESTIMTTLFKVNSLKESMGTKSRFSLFRNEFLSTYLTKFWNIRQQHNNLSNWQDTAVRALVWNNGTLLCKIDFNRNLSF